MDSRLRGNDEESGLDRRKGIGEKGSGSEKRGLTPFSQRFAASSFSHATKSATSGRFAAEGDVIAK
jgi:hypothetical protein